jgi:RecA-family ATPase
MVDCPECGKPLKRNKHKARYCCENSTCSVIFVCHPDKPSLMRITRKAEARSSMSEQTVPRIALKATVAS